MKVIHEKFVYSPQRGAFWIYVVKFSLFRADVLLAVPQGAGKKLVWHKRYFFPFAAPLLTISARLAEAFAL